MTAIAIVDVDAQVPLADRQAAAAALQVQSQRDFAPAWSVVGLEVRAATPDQPPRAGEWVAELRSSLMGGDAGTLAVHDVQDDGTPVIRVDVGACRKFGDSWTSALSHEVCEASADPDIVRCAQAPDGQMWCLEVCDACEQDTYLIDGVEVSNFCTPAWFAPPKSGRAKFDHLGLCSRAFQILSGGYGQVWDPRKGWRQLGQMRAYRRHIAALGAGRGAKRPKAGQSWLGRLIARARDYLGL